jgi:hypothetical protein
MSGGHERHGMVAADTVCLLLRAGSAALLELGPFQRISQAAFSAIHYTTFFFLLHGQ